MTTYRTAEETVKTVVPSKYDGFKLLKTEHPYRCQKGSGRARIFDFAKDGMTVGEWTKVCAQRGFDSKFVVGSILKLLGAKEPGWVLSEKNDKGLTLEEVKKIRDQDPEKKAAAEARNAEKEVERKRKADERAAARTKKAEDKAAAKKKAEDAKASKVTKDAAAKDPKAQGQKTGKKVAA